MVVPITARNAAQAKATLSTAAGGFNPGSISGLVAWYDASDAASITASGGLVSQWNDKSGHGYHLTQATGVQQPTTGTRTQNGLNVLDFTGRPDWLASATAPMSPTTQSLFIVTRFDSLAGQHTLVDGDGSGALDIRTNGTAFETLKGAFGNIGNGYSAAAFSTATAYLIGHQFRDASNGNDLTYNVNGTTETDSTHGQTLTAGRHLRVGLNSAAIESHDGWIAELLYYQPSISGVDTTTVIGYLKTKWGTP